MPLRMPGQGGPRMPTGGDTNKAEGEPLARVICRDRKTNAEIPDPEALNGQPKWRPLSETERVAKQLRDQDTEGKYDISVEEAGNN